MEADLLATLILLCGFGHIALSVGSVFIPKALKWQQHLKSLQPLLRQMFWTYAAYILVINFCFGIVSLIATDEFLNGSMLAKSITFFISVYWFARIAIQFFYFERSEAPRGVIYTLGEIMLVILFASFTIVYFAAFLYNNSWI
jgi:hypothetical protein